MDRINQFILIDDDLNNNFLCAYIIKSVARDTEITEFTSAEDGLNYIKLLGNRIAEHPEKSYTKIVLLDLKMPFMNGWGFLKQYDLLEEHIKNIFRIYIVSSSIDITDKDKAASNPYIKGYVVKPLTKGTVQNILTGLL